MTDPAPTPQRTTQEQVLRATVGLCLSERYGEMIPEERDGLLYPHEEHLTVGLDAINTLIKEAKAKGVAEAWAKIRKGEGVDTFAVDAAIESPDGPDDDAIPEAVPRVPFAGGL